MISHENNDGVYWNEQVKIIQREIEELESFLNNNQNAVSPDGEDTSELMTDAETDLLQTRNALKHAKIELARIKREEEIAEILPQIEQIKMRIAQLLRQSDTEGAKELKMECEKLEEKVQGLRKDPIQDSETE